VVQRLSATTFYPSWGTTMDKTLFVRPRDEASANLESKMEIMTEGMRRLGIVLGVLASAAWVISIALISKGYAQIQPLGWAIFIVGIPASFGTTFFLVWGIDWVIAGFRDGSKP
jgi:hypothetical protein